MVWIGAISSVVAAALGLLLVNQDDYGGNTVTIHQWSGLATMTLAILTVLPCAPAVLGCTGVCWQQQSLGLVWRVIMGPCSPTATTT